VTEEDNMKEPIKPQNQDIFIIAPSDKALKAGEANHPEEAGAQDIVIGNSNGILYHVDVKTWRNDANKVRLGQLPEIVQQMYKNRTVLAYVPLDEKHPNETKGYYLANFAILNDERPHAPDTSEPPGNVYRLSQSAWFDQKRPLHHMFWPGNSTFLLEILNRGTAIAYISKAARTMDCFCYLLNLASINGKTVFDPTPSDDPKCELRAEEEEFG
jgi:hypothetical protein